MFEWNESYEIGVPAIDDAHQQLFAVINRANKIIKMGGNAAWAVMESIKFFKNYAINHFQEEEKFMLEVNYSQFERHKHVHDTMREKILPRLYSELEATRYSEESVKKFLNACEKWLVKHILGHDRELIKWRPETEPA